MHQRRIAYAVLLSTEKVSESMKSYCPPSWSEWGEWSACDNFSSFRKRNCGESEASKIICDGGPRKKFEFKQCGREEAKMIVFGGKETTESIKLFKVSQSSVRTEYLTPNGDPGSLSSGTVLCSGSIDGNFYVTMSVMDEEGRTEIRTYVYNWTKFSLVRAKLSDLYRQNASCIFSNNLLMLCGGWNHQKGTLRSCEAFDGKVSYQD